jgi:Amt family ammonium transporter
VAARACVNTVLSSSTGALSAMLLNWVLTKDFDLAMCLNGALGGLVSITGCCFCVEMWAALVIGMIGGMVYVGSSRLMLKLKIDDPLDATAVHFFCGMWGLLAGGFFAVPEYTGGPPGVVYGGGEYLGTAVMEIVVVICWVVGCTFPWFFAWNRCGLLRISADMEEAGIDASAHGGSAYPESAFLKPDLENNVVAKHEAEVADIKKEDDPAVAE